MVIKYDWKDSENQIVWLQKNRLTFLLRNWVVLTFIHVFCADCG